MAITLGEISIGLDISDRSLKIVKLIKRGKKISLAYFNYVDIPAGVIENGEVKNEKKLIDLISTLAKKAKIKKNSAEEITSVLPETKTFIKLIEIPTAKTSEKGKKEKEIFEELVKQEIINHIPLSPDDIYIDWQILNRSIGTTTMLIGAVAKEISDTYYNAIDKGGLKPNVLEIEAAPVIRSLLKEDEPGAKIIIDFGATRTGLVVYSQKTAVFTVSLPISGENITQTIATTLKMDVKKAEESKIVCGLDESKCEGALLKILMEPINNMASHIVRALAYYQSNFPKGEKISEVVLCGGGANFINIEKVLSQKVGLPVIIGNPLANLTPAKKVKMEKSKALSYTTAIGLALNEFQKNK